MYKKQMADSIHYALAAFRDTMLTAVARLEFTLRDTVSVNHSYGFPMNHNSCHEYDSSTHSSDVQDNSVHFALKKMEATVQELTRRMNDLTVTLPHSSPASSLCAPPSLPTDVVQELMSIQFPERTGNILVPSVRSTPALATAIAAANVPSFTLSDEEEVDAEEKDEDEAVEVVLEEEEDEEGEVVEEEDTDQESSSPLKKVVIKGVTYYMDDDQAVYHETDDGYEQVGTYNPKTDSVEILEETEEDEEEEEEEEEEEAVEVEEFVFKGKTYQRDSEQNVYLDGELIGTWNGKKIVATT